MRKRSTRRLVGSGLAAAGLTLGILAGPVASGAVSSHATSTLNVAWGPGVFATSTFPFYTGSNCYTVDIDYWDLQVRPGIWFGLGPSIGPQYAMSPFNQPTFGSVGGDTTATITLKGWQWSDGAGHTQTMTARDVAFWLNMDKAQKNGGSDGAACGYSPGFGIPDQVKSVTYPGGLGGNTIVIQFTGNENQKWLLGNELSQIIPMTTNWDVTTSGGAPGSGGCSAEPYASVTSGAGPTPSGDPCNAVFKHLSSLQGNDPAWNWADGPYRQSQFEYASGNPDGNDIQVVNNDYSGPASTAAHAVKTIVYVPYASSAAEVADLQANKLDYGYAEPNQVTPSPGPGKAGTNKLAHMTQYKTLGSVDWGVFYWSFNYDNSGSAYHTSGKLPYWADLNNTTYFRAAIQESENQPLIIKHVFFGYEVPDWSGVPAYPSNPYGAGIKNPYPYSATKGKLLMAAHGWNTKVFPAVCMKANCGTGAFPIKKGTKATETVIVPSGSTSVTLQTQDIANEVKAGADIQIKAKFLPGNTVGADCFAGAAAWQICGYGGWIFAPDFYPSGEVLFLKGSPANNAGYANSEMTGLINDTTTLGAIGLNQNDPKYHTSYGEYSATQVPVLWQPVPAGFVEQRASIVGMPTPNPLVDFNPEYVTAI